MKIVGRAVVCGVYGTIAATAALSGCEAAEPASDPQARATALESVTDPPDENQPPPIAITVGVSSPPIDVNLEPIFTKRGELRVGGGLKYRVIGNDNPYLVGAELSAAWLTVTVAPGVWGQASLTIGASDADGVGIRQQFLITVLPFSLPAPSGPAVPAK